MILQGIFFEIILSAFALIDKEISKLNFTVSFKLRDMIFARSFLIDISFWSMRLLSNHEQRTLSCSTLSISYISQSNFRSSAESHLQKHFTTRNDGPKKLVLSSVCKLKPTSRFPVLKADCFLELNTFVLIGRCDLFVHLYFA